jgi:hypothetical protein
LVHIFGNVAYVRAQLRKCTLGFENQRIKGRSVFDNHGCE